MTILSTLLSLFPALVILMAFISFLFICFLPSIFSVTALFFSLYIFPLLVYKIHEKFYPLQEGISYLLGKNYSPWWGTHQIQVVYITFPALEAGLRLIPGAFSLWLRLWGAKVGKNVYWTPHLEIADRSLLEIGDNVVFGHRIGIYSHVIKPKKQDLMLYVKKVKIGSNVFLGAGSYIGPGVQIVDETFVAAGSYLYPNQVVKNISNTVTGLGE
ncbi:MAG: acyl transferase [Chlorogloeopsis fritschii C42_A2020_084]|uniref:DapH/DapD/GlmU-related protein n=1 Tax=Chlorogloeopsis fritschii TaxID=1124 RepID=UPI001A0985EA|nr:DapH/DapD/GlmU-related protein [Chlorogloeopsis fritschii]MBF2008030.1 acyl transferase [Chlorogloeopsis fritschii C42_A2020_084]